MNITSSDLLNELTTTELVQLKDAVDAEIERLDAKAKEHSGDPEQYAQARVFAGWRKQKQDLGWKLKIIIETRLEEDKGKATIEVLRHILAPIPEL
jgi:hypothetical protein